MTATYRHLGMGRDAGLYYVNDPDREARPHSRDEYYAGDGSGVWWSSGETVVADGAPVHKESFRDLCAGVHPGTGAPLVRGAGEKHRAGWDITFSAPKALSLLWAIGDGAERADLAGLHRKAVDAALKFVERQQLLEVRLGAGGTVRQLPTDIIVGRFHHYTSREGDPNLHTHCVFMNVAGSADGRHRTLETKTLYQWELTLGAAYRAEVSRQLVERGYRLRKAGQGQIEIAGIEEEVLDVFSKRRNAIDAMVGDRRRATAAQKQIAALATRRAKSEVPTGEVLEARWRDEVGGRELVIRHGAREAGLRSLEHHLGLDDDAASTGPALDPVMVPGEGPVARAASQMLTRESVIGRRELLRQSMIEASYRGIGIAAVEAELHERQGRAELLTLREGRSALWTTEHIVQAEAAMLRASVRPDERTWLTPEATAAALEAAPHLSDEQQLVVTEVAGRDGAVLVEAGAGTGKTTLARTLCDAAARSDLRVVGLAPTWVAADELAKSAGIPVQSVAKWRWDRVNGPAGGQLRLDTRTVILLDEAGMLGTLDLSAVMTAAQKAGSKVVIFGDRRQLASISQGSALSAVASQLERVATLKAVRRQTVDWQRDASIAMTDGHMAEALSAYHRQGRIHFANGIVAALEETVAHWSSLRTRHGDEVVMIARTNRDVTALNRLARQTLQRDGHLPVEEVTLPALDRKNKLRDLKLAVGDRVRFSENLKPFGLRNGTRATVIEVSAPSAAMGLDTMVAFRLEDGQELRAAWHDLVGRRSKRQAVPRISHAYAGTTHSLQGRTVEAAVFHVGMSTDAREVYVAMTRHRQDVCMVVDSERLMAGVDLHELEPERDQDLDLGTPGLSEAAPGGTPKNQVVDPRLVALQAEAERYDEKANVHPLLPLIDIEPQRRVPDLSRSPGIER